ncbi:hypothetical protein HMPREF1565_0647 [Providencia alcalifaciens RIMD 1656011]|nr:hypothetical protein HMPREF1565_0647 [Providencia alcalifaciens RIMD 1656011]
MRNCPALALAQFWPTYYQTNSRLLFSEDTHPTRYWINTTRHTQ